MKQCNNTFCNKESYDDAKFCYNCGYPFVTDYVISYPTPDILRICIQNSSKKIDETIRFCNPVVGTLFIQAIECYSHQSYFGCIALSAEAVAKAISVELQGGDSSVKRKKIPHTNNFQSKVDSLVREYPALKHHRKNILTLYNLYRKVWLHGIGEHIIYGKGRFPNTNAVEVVSERNKHPQQKADMGEAVVIPLGGLTKEELLNDYGLSDTMLITHSGEIADKCISLAIPILKDISALYK